MRNELEERIYYWVLDLLAFSKTVSKDNATQIIIRQLIRSGTSVGANYTEAQAGSSRKDFANFVLHALKSANESFYWLRLLGDLEANKSIAFNKLFQEISEIRNILGSISSKIRK